MQEQTKTKLNILVKTNKINHADLEFLKGIDEDLRKYDNDKKEEMLLIHVAMSLARQKDKGIIDKMPDKLWEQVVKKPDYQEAKKYWLKKESEAPVLLSKNESQYIIMHIVNVLTKVGS